MKKRYRKSVVYHPKGNVWFHGTHPMNVPKILKTGLKHNRYGNVWKSKMRSNNWTLTSIKLNAQRGYGYDTPHGVVKVQLPVKKIHKYLIPERKHSNVRAVRRTIPARYIKAIV
jgi:hypothetical protein